METELNGKRYHRIDGEWYDETNVKPPRTVAWELDRKAPAPAESRVPINEVRKKATAAKPVAEFGGLADTDFKSNVDGTSWRGKPSLGGLLAQHLSARTGQTFKSWPVPRRPDVYIYVPELFDEEIKPPCAKFDFRLSKEHAQICLYVEKTNQTLDHHWDWSRLAPALADGNLRHAIAKVMARDGLVWHLESFRHIGDKSQLAEVIVSGSDPLQWQGPEGTETIGWDTFLARLDAFPEHQWVDLRLGRTIPKAEAIAAKSSLASKAAEVYVALMPLYEAVSIVRS